MTKNNITKDNSDRWYTDLANGKISSGTVYTFLLITALRNLTPEHLNALCADLYVRSQDQKDIDNRIGEMTKSPNSGEKAN